MTFDEVKNAPWMKAPFIAGGVLALALLGMHAGAIANLWSRWGGQQELSHSYFIPLVSAWLVWQNRDAVRASIGAPSWAGTWIFVGALLLFLLGQLTQVFMLQQLSLVACIAGGVAAFGGLSLLRRTAAPIAFLLFAVPPPYWFITVLSWNFQQISSVLGVGFLTDGAGAGAICRATLLTLAIISLRWLRPVVACAIFSRF